jgi:hypothetical protein
MLGGPRRDEETSMARKPSKKEAPIVELADKLLRVLQSQRSLGPDAYPLSVKRLVELTDPTAAPALVKKALNKRDFLKQAVRVHAKAPDAPVALAADLDRLALSPLLLEFALRRARTNATQAFTVSQLKEKAAGKVRKPFQDAVNRQVAQGTLPPSVGWVSIQGRKQLFLLTDLHVGDGKPPEARPQPAPAPAAPPQAPAPPPPTPATAVDFRAAFDAAFERLDREGGGHNFVSLTALRGAVPLPREEFDRELRQLRQAGRYSLSAAEGRHGISPEEREAGIPEEGSLLLFVSRTLP